MRKIFILLFGIIVSNFIFAQDQLKVMSYNLLDYGNYTSYCTTSNNLQATKEGYLKKIIHYYKPDIFGAVEIIPSNTVAQSILTNVLNVNGVNYYKRSNMSNQSSSDLMSMVYYNSQKVELLNQKVVNVATRDISVYTFYYKSSSLATKHDTIYIYCLVAHLKAGSLTTDQAQRATMTQNVMNYIQNYMPIGNYMIMGDFNTQSSGEDAFQKLVNPINTAYKFIDPINKLGTWNNNSSFSNVHTQSTHLDDNGCAASGGMDDRFDFILTSQSIISGNKGAKYVSGSYSSLGNDGNHYNQSINNGSNTNAPDSVIQSLYGMSDHLPVMLKLRIDTTTLGFEPNNLSEIQFWFENPIENFLLINLEENLNEEINAEVIDLSGRVLIQSKILKNQTNQEFRISLEGFKPGIYLVRLTSESGLVGTKKLIKL